MVTLFEGNSDIVVCKSTFVSLKLLYVWQWLLTGVDFHSFKSKQFMGFYDSFSKFHLFCLNLLTVGVEVHGKQVSLYHR